MERANRDIKTIIIRHAYGFTNFSRLRNRIMYVKNDDATILYNRKEMKKGNGMLILSTHRFLFKA
ncbi:MAG: hypothetical protein K6A63_00600 [Acholeplasmatales bacterium]|nr:hypothetical protein [Acholeplasmatales bacterium]